MKFAPARTPGRLLTNLTSGFVMCKQNFEISWKCQMFNIKCKLSRNQPDLSNTESWSGHIEIFLNIGTTQIHGPELCWTPQSEHQCWPKMMKILTPNSSPICPLQRYYSTSVALYESCKVNISAPQSNEIRASEDPRRILSPTPAQIRHDQAKFWNSMKTSNVQTRNANYSEISRTSRPQNLERGTL